MRRMGLYLLSGMTLLSLAGETRAANSFGRSYSFGFTDGNLIRNWSFENLADNWYEEPMADPRYPAKKDNISAITGSFVAKFSGANTTSGVFNRFVSDYYPVDPGSLYCVSFYVKTSGNTAGGVHPVMWFYSDRTGLAGTVTGSIMGGSYPINSDWTFYTYYAASPAGSVAAKLSLIEISPNQGGTFYFDDVVLEPGVITPGSRNKIQEAVAFVNDAGQVVESYQKISGGGNNPSRKYLVAGGNLDAQLRNTEQYAPYIRSGMPDYDPAFATNSANYNNGSNGKGTLGSTPYSRVEYTEELLRPVSATYMPGTAWANVPIMSGGYYTSSLTAPASPESESTNDAELPYYYSWSKDVEGRYSLTWNNSLGQTIQTAVKPNTTWLYTRFEYFANGKLKKVLQNSDVPGNDSQQDFREVTNYNAGGEITSTYTKDRGLTKFWYNRLGQLRFSRHESQLSTEFDYVDYDHMDRPISMGVQIIGGFSTAIIEQRATSSAQKTEHKGQIYDNLDQFQARTGLVLATLMPGKVLGIRGASRLVCEYNLNKGVTLASLSNQDRFVATFYNYNVYGEVSETYKFIGAVKDPAHRIHKVTYYYNTNHRLVRTITEDNGSPAYTTFQEYLYDDLGRIIRVTGSGSRFLSGYEYFEWGEIKSVTLGGSGNTSTGTRIDFSYHAQGWVKEIKATRQATGEVVFQQMLGYEEKVVNNATIPALDQVKKDGSISQQLYKFAKDVETLNPIRLVNYKYDGMNRMLQADARKNSGMPQWDANQNIIFNSLQLMDAEDMDSRLTFDDAGRIATNQNGVSAVDKAVYSYQGNSYKLDKVSGKLSAETGRDASAAGTFVYDTRGRMIEDKSKKMNISYGWDDMPIEFAVDTGDSLISDFNLYDAGGQRVSRVRVKTVTKVLVPIMLDGITFFVPGYLNTATLSAKVISSITDVNILSSGDRRWVENYDDAGQIATSSARYGIFGISGQIGEITPTGAYRFFVKNHLGSIMRSVGDDGEYLDGEGNTIDYLSYGSLRKLKTGTTEQVSSFTGKELELVTGLYAFGARWQDPDLGIFLTADPAGQYANPYSYGGGNAINGTDPNGMWWNPFDSDDWDDLGTSIRDWDRHSAYGGWSDLGDAFADIPGDLHTWAGGYGRGDEDNILRQIYRSVTRKDHSGAPNCGSDRGEGGCWDVPPEDQGGIGIGVTFSDGGQGGVFARDINGNSLFPLYSWDPSKDRQEHLREAAQRQKSVSRDILDHRLSQQTRPGDDVEACGPCLLIIPALPYISMVTPMILVGGQAIYRYGMLAMPYIPALQGLAMRGATPALNMAKQGKHILGHNNYISGKSILSANPIDLARRAGSGVQVGPVARGLPGFRERIDFGYKIGEVVRDGVSTPTTRGIIHYSKEGIHIVPSNPY
jgi:RHS repeat-associated protein